MSDLTTSPNSVGPTDTSDPDAQLPGAARPADVAPVAHSGEAIRPADDENAWSIDVDGGAHAGTHIPLGPGNFNIGCDLGNDIILADTGVHDQQFRLGLELGQGTIEALAEGVSVDGHAMSPGDKRPVNDDSRIEVGEARMHLHGPRKVFAGPYAWIGGALVAAALAGGLMILGGGPLQARPPSAALVPAAATSPTQAASALRAHLVELGIEGVSVTDAAGAVVAEGALSAGNAERWKSVGPWFDAQARGSMALIDRVHVAAPVDTPHLTIRSVSIAGNPSETSYVVVGNGDRLTEGAAIDGGWTIVQIEPNRLVLKRDGKTFDLGL